MKIFFLLEKSCFKTVIVALCILALGLGMPRANAQVPGVIIDQDLSSDHDDVGDLTVLNALYLTGECKILACICDSANSATPECMDCINTYFGHGSVPCGSNPDAMGPGGYPATIASEFPHTQTNYPDGLIVYRQVLAAAPSNSVIIVTTGFLNMLERLMQSPGDSISPLTGMQLIEQKVKLLACAGGSYPSGGEFNFTVAGCFLLRDQPLADVGAGNFQQRSDGSGCLNRRSGAKPSVERADARRVGTDLLGCVSELGPAGGLFRSPRRGVGPDLQLLQYRHQQRSHQWC